MGFAFFPRKKPPLPRAPLFAQNGLFCGIFRTIPDTAEKIGFPPFFILIIGRLDNESGTAIDNEFSRPMRFALCGCRII